MTKQKWLEIQNKNKNEANVETLGAEVIKKEAG